MIRSGIMVENITVRLNKYLNLSWLKLSVLKKMTVSKDVLQAANRD